MHFETQEDSGLESLLMNIDYGFFNSQPCEIELLQGKFRLLKVINIFVETKSISDDPFNRFPLSRQSTAEEGIDDWIQGNLHDEDETILVPQKMHSAPISFDFPNENSVEHFLRQTNEDTLSLDTQTCKVISPLKLTKVEIAAEPVPKALVKSTDSQTVFAVKKLHRSKTIKKA